MKQDVQTAHIRGKVKCPKTFGNITYVIYSFVKLPEKDHFIFKRVLVDIILTNQHFLNKVTDGFGCPVPVQVDYREVIPKIVKTPNLVTD